jgi:hypothetical protein
MAIGIKSDNTTEVTSVEKMAAPTRVAYVPRGSTEVVFAETSLADPVVKARLAMRVRNLLNLVRQVEARCHAIEAAARGA